MAKQTLKQFALENPLHTNKISFLDHPKIKDLTEEALAGIRDGISPTTATHWLIKESPIEVTVKFHTIRMNLSSRAKTNS